MSWNDRLLNKTSSPWQGTKPPGNVLEIVEIFPGSIAEAADLKPGMLYIPTEKDKSATEWSAISARGATGKLISRFVDPAAATTHTIETIGFPWGMRLDLPNHLLVEEVLATYVNPTRLAAPLLSGTDTAFQDLTNAALKRANRPSMKQRLIKTLLGVLGRGSQLDPVIRFQKAVAAIAATHTGDVRQARRLMPQLDTGLLHDFGTGAGAVCLLAEATVAKAEGRPRQDIAHLLRGAFELVPTSQRLASALTEQGEPTEAKRDHTIARPFEIDYELPVADVLDGPLRPHELASSPRMRLSTCLAKLGPDQLGVVIMLNGYRVNGPYSWLIENLGHLYELMGPRLPFVHVVSSLESVSSPETIDLWKPGETYARSRRVPITVMHDSSHAVYHSLAISTSPVMYLLTREGTVLYQGNSANDGPFWEAFERLDGIRKVQGQRGGASL